MRARAGAIRIATGFFAVFFVLGIHVPYWPVWLQSRGLSPQQIGVVLALGPWMRLLANPLAGQWADATGATRRIAVVLAMGVSLTYLAFSQASSFAVYVALAVVLGLCANPLIPLTDAVAVRVVAQGRGDYGSLRRWGSLAFIVASVIGGRVLQEQPASIIVWVLAAAGVGLALVMSTLPGEATRLPSAGGAKELLRRRDVRIFLLCIGCLHASHSMLYAFGTAHWRAQGVDASTIGWLWAEGVVAEIVLFSLGPRFSARLGAPGLLVLAGVGGLLRWPTLASTASVPWLVAIQLLHAATFGALHLGAMEFIRRRVGAAATTRATTTYSAVAGMAMGLGLPLSGWLYDDLGGTTYWAMAGCSAAGLLAAGWLYAAIRRTDDADRPIAARSTAARSNDGQVGSPRAGTGPGRDR